MTGIAGGGPGAWCPVALGRFADFQMGTFLLDSNLSFQTERCGDLWAWDLKVVPTPGLLDHTPILEREQLGLM